MDKLTRNYDWIEIKKINKGMSSDIKYKVKDKLGHSYLLRVSEINLYNIKMHEYELIQMWNKSNIPMPKAVDFGTCNEGKNVYTLLEWIEGIEIDNILPSLSHTERYELGKESGRILNKIHTITEPKYSKGWSEQYFSVIDNRLNAYKYEKINFKGDSIILKFLENNAYLLKNRPQCYLHGDYHMGNIIYSQKKELNIIDWHTVDFDNYGDPWYEFNRIGVEYPEFASGQIDGYFEDNIPEEFWKLFAFYLSASAITSIVWAKYWAPEEYDNIIQLNNNILKWFDDMKILKPSWYMKPNKYV